MKNISALLGTEQDAQQVVVTMLALDIPAPWGPLYVQNLDVPLYLNPDTNATGVAPGAGLELFRPSEFEIPSLDESDESNVSSISVTADNADEYWFGVLADGTYRDCVARIWRGNLEIGATPDNLTFTGALLVFRGTLLGISATYAKATIELESLISQFATQWPYLYYTPTEFKHMPVPGTVLTIGGTTKKL